MSEFVYHGTDITDVSAVFESGIQPRSRTAHNSDWLHKDVPAIESHVDLSKYYAHYYGIRAGETTAFAIYEVDIAQLATEELYPHEDYVVQAIEKDLIDIQLESLSRKQQTAVVRETIDLHQSAWRDSLEMLGNLSKKEPIPSSAVRRAAVVTDPPTSFLLAIDPTITIENARLCGDKYEAYTKACFSRHGELPEIPTHVEEQMLDVLKDEMRDELAPTIWENPHFHES